MINFIKALFGFSNKQEQATPKVECVTDWECANMSCYQNPFDGQDSLSFPDMTRTELIDTLEANPVSFIEQQGWGLDPSDVDHSNFNPELDQMTQSELIDLAGADSVKFVDLLLDWGWV